MLDPLGGRAIICVVEFTGKGLEEYGPGSESCIRRLRWLTGEVGKRGSVVCWDNWIQN